MCEPPADPRALARLAQDKAAGFPTVSGSSAAPGFGPRAQAVVQEALAEGRRLGDRYCSNEVLGLALHAPDACGPPFAAAGVAAAFGAPLGGVMFCLEEGASWWYNPPQKKSYFYAKT